MTENKIKDESSDRSYFIITPRLVWALSEDVYEYTLWQVIKDVAGENGECFINTPDLAVLSMMSTGKVAYARKKLLDKGLLVGEIRQDPGYPQPVWHLRVPDLWLKNSKWATTHPTFENRLDWKIRQKELSSGESFHGVKAREKLSPGEKGPSPHESSPVKELSPGETKKIQYIDPKEDEEDVWQKFLIDLTNQSHSNGLEERAARQRYNDYYRHTSLIADQGDVWLIACPDETNQQWMEQRFKRLLEQELSARLARPITLEFIYAEPATLQSVADNAAIPVEA